MCITDGIQFKQTCGQYGQWKLALFQVVYKVNLKILISYK